MVKLSTQMTPSNQFYDLGMSWDIRRASKEVLSGKESESEVRVTQDPCDTVNLEES